MAHILIAEDDVNIFNLVEFRLKRQGHEISWAPDGGEAVAQARAQQPDLILLDIMMPVLDGFQVLAQLKADAATKDIPVIFLTARGQETDIVSGMGLGASDYIVKPFSFPEMLMRINVALARRAA